jgi:hypothetical protein
MVAAEAGDPCVERARAVVGAAAAVADEAVRAEQLLSPVSAWEV